MTIISEENNLCKTCNKSNIKFSKIKLCRSCYRKSSKKLCSLCNKTGTIEKKDNIGNPICKNCYRKEYKQPVHSCDICLRVKIIRQWTLKEQQIGICDSCYMKKYIKKKYICSICGKYRPAQKTNLDNTKICNICYKTPNMICNICKKNKPAYSKQGPLCKKCWNNNKLKTDMNFYLKKRLRTLLGSAIKKYSNTTKRKSKYKVDYQLIINHLGPCPGPRNEWHIDHIVPLCLFDLNDPKQLKAAFAPENHQWLTKEENLKKGKKILEEEVREYFIKWDLFIK